MIQPTVWLQPGLLIVYGESFDATAHHHHAIQIIWPKKNTVCTLNGVEHLTPVVINSTFDHQLQLSEGWILLVEPQSTIGQKLSDRLNGSNVKALNVPLFNGCTPQPLTRPLTDDLLPLLQGLNLTKINHEETLRIKVQDKRLIKLIDQLNQCLQGECIKPSHWRAADVAQQLALSESRFLHLFRQQSGIAWRPYLLWQRMICAIHAMVNKRSATDAAHLSGFSDSAHLSRTFKQNFGMTIRQANALFNKE